MNTLVRIYANTISKDWDKENLINRLKATIRVASEGEIDIIDKIIDKLSQEKISPINGLVVARIIRACTKGTAYFPSVICEQILQSYYLYNNNFVFIPPFDEFPEGIDILFYDYPVEYDHDTSEYLDNLYADYNLKNPLKHEEYLKQYSLKGLKAFCKAWEGL